MSRELRNISGVDLWVDDGTGALTKVAADGIIAVSDDDERYWSDGSTGEQAVWADAGSKSKKTTPAKEEK